MFKNSYEKLQEKITFDTSLVESTIYRCQKEERNVVPYAIRKSLIVVAMFIVVFISSINVVPVLAANLEKVPMLEPIIRVLTIKSYTEDFEDFNIQIEQPYIEDKSNNQCVFDTNAVIEEKIETYRKEAEQHIQEYKEAFIATGGTEDEFVEKNIEVNVEYEIKTNDTNYLSFALEMYEDWNASYAIYTYYNFDVLTGKELTLEDLLGKNFIHIANTTIQDEIDKNPDMYFQDFSVFTTINGESNFYINEDGNPVIVFEKYEIAPGAMGRPEFVIAR